MGFLTKFKAGKILKVYLNQVCTERGGKKDTISLKGEGNDKLKKGN